MTGDNETASRTEAEDASAAVSGGDRGAVSPGKDEGAATPRADEASPGPDRDDHGDAVTRATLSEAHSRVDDNAGKGIYQDDDSDMPPSPVVVRPRDRWSIIAIGGVALGGIACMMVAVLVALFL